MSIRNSCKPKKCGEVGKLNKDCICDVHFVNLGVCSLYERGLTYSHVCGYLIATLALREYVSHLDVIE